jgi:hypothetical protein
MSCRGRRAAVVSVVLHLVVQISDVVIHGETLLSSTGDMVPREADAGAIREVRYAVIV